MRILYHHRTLADGAEGIHIRSMVEAFRALGHEVHVHGIATTPGGASSRVARAVRHTLPGAALELASTAVNLPEYVQVRRAIERFSPDLIYKRHSRYDVAALEAARRTGIPSVLEVNSLFTEGAYHSFEPLAMRSLAARLERRALALATVVVAVSTPLSNQVRSLVSRRVSVLPNGADPELFNPLHADRRRIRERHGLGDRLTVGWTGILRDWHGLGLLLEALEAVPEVRLLIVGDGPARAALEVRIEAGRLRDRVVVTGRVPHDTMRDYVAAMDIAVVADERTGVASPMKLLEYMAMARAVVAPRLANIRDLVEEGVDGLLFCPNDSVDLGGTLRRLGSNEGLRQRLGRAARTKIETTRNWQHNARAVIQLASASHER